MHTTSASMSAVTLYAAVVGAPLFAGSTAPIAVAIWCMVLAVGLVLADPGQLRSAQRRWLWLPALVVAAYAAVLLAQMLPTERTGLPPHPIWARASSLLGKPLEGSVAIVHDEPLLAVGAPLAALMAALLGFFVGAERGRARMLIDVIAWSGAAMAAFAIASHLVSPGKLFWWDKTAYREVLTTPFVNRNAAALYYGVCGIAAGLRFWHQLRARLPAGRLSLTAIFEPPPADAWYRELTTAAPLLLCLCAVLLTSSRAGTVLALAGQVLGFTLFFARDLPRRLGPLSALLLGGLVALTILQTLGGGAGNRFDEYGLVDAGRIDTYHATLRMISDFPWLGVGLGGFPFAFPAYRMGSFWGVWDRAHNVLLETAAEGGVPLALVVTLAWILVLLLLATGVRHRRRDTMFPVIGLTVAAMALAHAMIDFSLQIPGFAIPVMAIIGVGAAQSFATRKPVDGAARTIGKLGPEERGRGSADPAAQAN
jgi:O-antigen ligase